MFGATTLLLAALIGYPSVKSILDLRDGIISENLKIEERYLRRQQIKKAVDTLQSAKASIGRLESLALREGRELEFINSLEAIAAETRMEQRIQLETVNQKNLSKWEREIPVSLSLTGRYTDLLTYLDRAEHLPYGIMIGGISISTPRAAAVSNPEGLVEARIDGVIYWQSKDAPSILTTER